MKKTLTMALASGASILLYANAGYTQESSRFTWDGEIELGYESVYDSDAAANEVNDPYLFIELNGEFAVSDSVSFFGGLTLEEMTGPSNGVRDLGMYFHELGMRFNAGAATFSIGKFHPQFGAAWDETAGFFGGTIAEDYELVEKIGGAVDYDMGQNGVLSFALFYADDTVLSESAFHNRGRNTTAAGGAGNTGQLDNASLQWVNEYGDTRVLAGLRYQSAGIGNVSDETGAVVGLGHSFGSGFDFYGEVAAFDGYEGTSDDATYVTMNLAYTLGQATTLSGTYVHRDLDSRGVLEGVSVGVEYEFQNNMTIGAALATNDDNGVRDNIFGVNLVLGLGG